MEEEQKDRRRVHIQSVDGRFSKVIDTQTGADLANRITNISIEMPPGGPFIAHIDVMDPSVDIVATANIQHICPCCGHVKKGN